MQLLLSLEHVDKGRIKQQLAELQTEREEDPRKRDGVKVLLCCLCEVASQ